MHQMTLLNLVMNMAIHCPDIPLTFVHIPKTAGSAVSAWLKTHSPHTRHEPPLERIGSVAQNGKRHPLFREKHNTFDEIRPHFARYGLDMGTVVVVVRNPWDRLVSMWAYLSDRSLSLGSDRSDRARFKSFRDFILDGEWGIATRPQTDFFKFSETIQSETIMLRFENLATDFRQIQSLCNCNEPLGVKNKSEHEHYSSYYDAETRDFVASKCAADINLLDYSYG